MGKLRFLLLDANVVFQLFEVGLWKRVAEKCEILLSRTIIESEIKYYRGKQSDRRIDLSDDVQAGHVRVVDVEAGELRAFLQRFDPVYLEKLDPGETEALAYLLSSQDPCLLCSSDKIVYRVLARVGREDQGISLEEVLAKVGLGRALPPQFSKAFRDRWTQKGREERIRGIGLKGKAAH